MESTRICRDEFVSKLFSLETDNSFFSSFWVDEIASCYRIVCTPEELKGDLFNRFFSAIKSGHPYCVVAYIGESVTIDIADAIQKLRTEAKLDVVRTSPDLPNKVLLLFAFF